VELSKQNKAISFYEKLGTELDIERYRSDTSWKVNVISSVLPNTKFNVVLEVGCGGGLVLKGISQSVKAKKAIGIDISTSMLSIARREYPGAVFVRGDAEHLPFKDQCIDLSILSDILEHVPYPGSVIGEARRISKNIAFKIPIEKSVIGELLRILRRKEYGDVESHRSGHLRAWTERAALSLISSNALTPSTYELVEPPDEIRYHDASSGFFAWFEKGIYRYARKIYRLLFGSTLVAFAPVNDNKGLAK
jgi:ubiquinone/menaquinone biosynthesis C-methylase UbiE